jgi:hypothetical protein
MPLLQRFSLVIACLALPAFVHAADFDKKNCTYKGIRLYGKVQIVTSFPDFKVQMVNSFPDLKVDMGSSSPGVR